MLQSGAKSNRAPILLSPSCPSPFLLQSICPSVIPSVCLSIRLSVCLSVRPSVRLSFHPSLCQSVCPSVHPPICLSVVYPAIILSVAPSIRLSVQMSVRQKKVAKIVITTRLWFTISPWKPPFSSPIFFSPVPKYSWAWIYFQIWTHLIIPLNMSPV